MKIIIKNVETQEELIEFNVRKNSKNKTIFDNIKSKLNEKFNINITNMLMYGKIDYATHVQDIHYHLFGKDLPFYNIDIVEA